MFTVHSLQQLQGGETYFLAFHEGHDNFYPSITGTKSYESLKLSWGSLPISTKSELKNTNMQVEVLK